MTDFSTTDEALVMGGGGLTMDDLERRIKRELVTPSVDGADIGGAAIYLANGQQKNPQLADNLHFVRSATE